MSSEGFKICLPNSVVDLVVEPMRLCPAGSSVLLCVIQQIFTLVLISSIFKFHGQQENQPVQNIWTVIRKAPTMNWYNFLEMQQRIQRAILFYRRRNEYGDYIRIFVEYPGLYLFLALYVILHWHPSNNDHILRFLVLHVYRETHTICSKADPGSFRIPTEHLQILDARFVNQLAVVNRSADRSHRNAWSLGTIPTNVKIQCLMFLGHHEQSNLRWGP